MIADLEKLAGFGSPDDPRTGAMQHAAALLRELAPARGDPFDDPAKHACGYRLDIDEETKHARIVFFHGRNQTDMLGFLQLESPEVYDLSTILMRKYDKLEGIE